MPCWMPQPMRIPSDLPAWRYLLPAIVWGSIVSWASLTSTASFPTVNMVSFDKVVHVGIYFVFSMLLFYGIIKQAASNKKKQFIPVFVLLIASLLGISIEVLQALGTADRSFEMLDILANIIGSLWGVTAFSLFH